MPFRNLLSAGLRKHPHDGSLAYLYGIGHFDVNYSEITPLFSLKIIHQFQFKGPRKTRFRKAILRFRNFNILVSGHHNIVTYL